MRLINIEPEEFGIKQNVRIVGVAVGSKGPGQTLFIMPVRGSKLEAEEDLWAVVPTTSGKPQLLANAADEPGGVILRLSTYNRPGRRIGRIYIRERDLSNVECVGFGVGGNEEGSVTWEEAVFRVHGEEAMFYLVNVGPPNEIVTVEGTEVRHQSLENGNRALLDDDYIRVDDPRVRRWKPPEDFIPHAV